MPENSIDTTKMPPTGANSPQRPQISQLFMEMLVSILLPTLILKKLSTDAYLGATWALCLALSLPLAYGLWRFYKERKFGFIPALGFVSILLTGTIGLLQLDPKYIAIKEATIPFLIGMGILISIKTPYPLVKTFIYNDNLLQVAKIDQHLLARGKRELFMQNLQTATLMLAGTFFISAILNYFLARYIVTAPAGTDLFNSQLGSMNLLSYPVIVLPSMVFLLGILFYIFKRIKDLSGLDLEEIVQNYD